MGDDCCLCGAPLPAETARDVHRSVRLFGRAVVEGKYRDACGECLRAVVVWCFSHRPHWLTYDAVMLLTSALDHSERRRETRVRRS